MASQKPEEGKIVSLTSGNATLYIDHPEQWAYGESSGCHPASMQQVAPLKPNQATTSRLLDKSTQPCVRCRTSNCLNIYVLNNGTSR